MKSQLQGFIKREFMTNYGGIAASIAWPVAFTLALACVMGLALSIVFGIHDKLFMFRVIAGMTVFQAFCLAVTSSLPSLADSRPFLRQFPHGIWALPIAKVSRSISCFLVGSSIVFIPLWILTSKQIYPFLKCIVLTIVISITFTIFLIGCSLTVSILGGLSRHIQRLLELITSCLFWATPVFYEVKNLPYYAKTIVLLNPVSAYVICFKDSLTYTAFDISPRGIYLTLCIFWAIITLIIGITLMRCLKAKVL